ncbi:MAG TPA: 50S ribosomal protein L3 N(5)-glutamine methyltransferase [Methylococcaceae bacterium]|nr:50S ribosomal protein L3 N(5)-glutamine methyltransferase [Methylococcaceae bacterium]
MSEAALQHLQTVRDWIRWGASRFTQAGLFFGHGTATAVDEAAALVLHTVHLPYDLPFTYFDAVLLPEERSRIFALIERRTAERKPLAYLLRETQFAGLTFYVDERVLVPRSPIAELIEERFAPWVDPDGVHAVLDLCTGSGCIAIAIAHAFPDAVVDATDISPDALAVARINVERHDLAERVRLIRADLFDGLEGAKYDLIVSNPPYVARAEWQGLPAEYHAEPRLGLESGADGLDAARRILAEAGSHLNPGGALIVEVGNSAAVLEEAFPEVPFCWLEFSRGGEGVFALTAEQLNEWADLFGNAD